jgi:hypothetical protein
MTSINTILTIIDTNRASNAARRKTHYDTHGAPTVGKDGRLHAPHDGYWWGENQYLGGQYLPEDVDFYVDTQRETLRIKILSSLQAKISLYASFGKAWQDKNGKSCCYAYLSLTGKEKETIEPLLPASGKRLVSVEAFGNPDNVKTWKHSTPRLLANANRQFGVGTDIGFFKLEDCGVELRYNASLKTKNKWQAFDYKGNLLDGAVVRYQYFDDLITG